MAGADASILAQPIVFDQPPALRWQHVNLKEIALMGYDEEPPKSPVEQFVGKVGTGLMILLIYALCAGGCALGGSLLLGMPLAALGLPEAALGLIALVSGGFGLVVANICVRNNILSPKPKDSHGSARFADTDETSALTAPDGLLVGLDRKSDAFLRYDGKAHLITLAPTRSGKGVGTIIPNLLRIPRSVIVIDPKGENARITGEARKAMGGLHVLDPFGISGHPSVAFNPLAGLDPGSLDLGEDAAALADALIVDPPDQVKDAHWNEEAKALLTGLILWCVCHESDDRRTLGRIREILTLPIETFAELLVQMQDSTKAHGLIARAANRQISKPEREAASVLSNAQRHTHFLDSPRMVKVTAQSDFRFSDLRRGTASVFIVLPPDRLDTYARWLRLIVSEALQDIVRDAQSPPEGAGGLSVASEGPTLFLLDEFASLGRLATVERAMGLMAGYGVQLWPILQDLSQLKSLYGESANTFMANSGVIQAFGVNDYETAKWLSLTMGQETREFTTRSSNGSSEGLHARDLLTPDEIMRLPSSLQILKLQGMHPVIAKKIIYWKDDRFKIAPREEKKVLRAVR